jgi:hypothetical protein
MRITYLFENVLCSPVEQRLVSSGFTRLGCLLQMLRKRLSFCVTGQGVW